MARAHTYDAALDRHLAAENSHDIEAILETFSESSEVVWSGRPYRGPDAIRKLHEGLGFGDAGAFSALAVIEKRRHYCGATIIVEQTLRGRHTGLFEGIAATGIVVEAPVCTLYEFGDDGILVSERPHVDRWAIWKQLGGNRAGLRQ